MKKLRKIISIAFVCIFTILSIPIMADQTVAAKAETCVSEYAVMMNASLSNYHCTNSKCQAYLYTQHIPWKICTKSGCSYYSYEYWCNYCNKRYAICPSGHLYNISW